MLKELNNLKNMAISKTDLSNILKLTFDESEFKIVDLAGDDDHYELQIISSKFKEMSKLKQHQMVYEVLKDVVGTKLHALALKTYIKD